MSSVLIKNGEIITSTDRYHADVYIENGVIAAIGKNLEAPSVKTRVIDAHGHYIFPGAIDAHVHMELPFMGTTAKATSMAFQEYYEKHMKDQFADYHVLAVHVHGPGLNCHRRAVGNNCLQQPCLPRKRSYVMMVLRWKFS